MQLANNPIFGGYCVVFMVKKKIRIKLTGVISNVNGFVVYSTMCLGVPSCSLLKRPCTPTQGFSIIVAG